MYRSAIACILLLGTSCTVLAQGLGQLNAPTNINSSAGRTNNSGFGGNASAFGATGQATTVPDFTYVGSGGFIGSQQTGFLGAGVTQQNVGGAGGGAQLNRGGGQFGNVGGFNARGQGNFQNRGFNQNQGRGGGNRPPVLRIRLSIGPGYQRVPSSVAQTNLNAQFTKLMTLRRFQGSTISAIPQGRTIVLRGRVSSDRDRALAVRIAKLEPGVSGVISELIVEEQVR